MAMRSDPGHVLRPAPRVSVPRGVSVRAGAAAWALAFAVEVMAEGYTGDDAEVLRTADALATEHRRVLEGEGYRLAGPFRMADGEPTWTVELLR